GTDLRTREGVGDVGIVAAPAQAYKMPAVGSQQRGYVVRRPTDIGASHPAVELQWEVGRSGGIDQLRVVTPRPLGPYGVAVRHCPGHYRGAQEQPGVLGPQATGAAAGVVDIHLQDDIWVASRAMDGGDLHAHPGVAGQVERVHT